MRQNTFFWKAFRSSAHEDRFPGRDHQAAASVGTCASRIDIRHHPEAVHVHHGNRATVCFLPQPAAHRRREAETTGAETEREDALITGIDRLRSPNATLRAGHRLRY